MIESVTPGGMSHFSRSRNISRVDSGTCSDGLTMMQLPVATAKGRKAVAALLSTDAREVYPAAVHHVELTERERAVLAELARGLSTLEIARTLFVSTNTVKSQLRTLYRKIDAHSRDEALEIAYRTGLID